MLLTDCPSFHNIPIVHYNYSTDEPMSTCWVWYKYDNLSNIVWIAYAFRIIWLILASLGNDLSINSITLMHWIIIYYNQCNEILLDHSEDMLVLEQLNPCRKCSSYSHRPAQQTFCISRLFDVRQAGWCDVYLRCWNNQFWLQNNKSLIVRK